MPTGAPSSGADVVWVLCSAGAIFFMQAGFQFLEAGQVHRKHQRNAVVKSYIGICFSAIFFYLIGYGIAFDGVDGKYAGHSMFAAMDIDYYRNWCFQYAFCAAFIAIVNGALLERARVELYIILVPILSSVIYPVVVAWTWGYGWLYQLGFVDFAGSSVVHLAGAVCTLTTAIIIGPRKGKFTNEKKAVTHKVLQTYPSDGDIKYHPERVARLHEENFSAYNVPMVGLGVMTLWFGWLFFNAGSTLSVDESNQVIAERALMNSIIGPASAGISNLFLKRWLAGSNPEIRNVKYDPMAILNGVLCGLVAITGNCAYTHAWASIVIASTAPVWYCLTLRLLTKLGIDDPSEAFPIHGPCGAWGILMCGIFDVTNGVAYGNNGRQIGIQLLGIVAIVGWDLACMLTILLPLKFIAKKWPKWNLLRVTEQEEEDGIDYHYHTYHGYIGHGEVLPQNTERKGSDDQLENQKKSDEDAANDFA